MPMNKTEEALVIAAKSGDTKCFEELYKLYYDKIYVLALTIVKNSADAEDVLQVTFIKAWQNIEKLENVSAFNTWLQRIAINQCNSMFRKSNKKEYSIDDEGDDGELLQIESDLMLPEQYAERDDLAIRLRSIIDELSVVQRETILLYYYNELSIEEIAQIMDCSEGTVKSRLFLARKAIKTEIEEQEKKSGEKFYGIAGVALIPFGGMFIREIKRNSISRNEAANIYNSISNTLFNSTQLPVTSAPSGTVASTASTVAKSVFPIWAKIVSVIAIVGLLTGGGIVAWNLLTPINPIVNAVVGDEFTYGQYEQDNNIDNGAENITWRVLDREDDKLLVVSKYVLDCITYEEYNPGSNWSNTGLRASLNTDFFNTAFTDEEQRYISDTYIFSGEDSTSDQEDAVVIDKVFILNEHETNQYFSSNDDRITYATEYALANGVETDANNHAIWWLRSHAHENHIDAVYEDGYVDNERGGFSGNNFGLRPAMWIDARAMAKKKKAENKVQPIDTSYLNNSLHRFLGTFALHFFDGTYDCERITESTNILHGVIGEAECISYNLYSEDLALADTYENWILSSENPSPIKEINDDNNPTYKRLDAKAVDKILTDIFHCTNEDIQRMRGWQDDRNPYGYANGYYYCSTGGHGDMPNQFVYVDGKYKDGCCYYTLDFYYGEEFWNNNANIEGVSPAATIYVKASLAAHEGAPWWTLYYYSQEPFSDDSPSSDSSSNKTIIAESSDEQPETVSSEQNNTISSNVDWSAMYYQYIIENNCSIDVNDEYHTHIDIYDETPLALHDFDMDGVPELIIGSIGARLALEVFTVYDGEVMYAGGVGGKASFFSDNESYHGIFRSDSWNETQVISYTGLSDGRCVTQEVLYGKYNQNTKEFNYSIGDETLYNVFLDCTIPAQFQIMKM